MRPRHGLKPYPLIGGLVAVADWAVTDGALGDRFVKTRNVGGFIDDASCEQDKPRLDYFRGGGRCETVAVPLQVGEACPDHLNAVGLRLLAQSLKQSRARNTIRKAGIIMGRRNQ